MTEGSCPLGTNNNNNNNNALLYVLTILTSFICLLDAAAGNQKFMYKYKATSVLFLNLRIFLVITERQNSTFNRTFGR